PAAAPAAAPVAKSPPSRQLTLGTNGLAVLRNADGQAVAELRGSRPRQLRLAAAELDLRGRRQRHTSAQAAVESALKEQTAQQERHHKAVTNLAAAHPPWQDALRAEARARARLALATGRWERLRSGPTNTPAAAGVLQAAAKERDDATAPARDAEAALTRTRRAWDNAENESQLAGASLARATFRLQQARWNLREDAATLAAAEARLATLKEEDTGPTPPTLSAHLSPDGRLAVTLDAAGNVRVWDADDGVPLEETTVAGARTAGFADPVTVTLATDAGTLHWAFLGRWELVRVIGADPAQSPLVDRVNALAFSRDGRWLASGSGEPSRSGEIRVWDALDATPRYALTNLHSDAVLALAWSPDGRWIASGGADRFVRMVDTATGRAARALEGHTGHVLGVAWSPGGVTLASAGADLLVKFWDVASGERRKQATGFTKEVVGVGWTADGQVAAAAGDPVLRVVKEGGEKVRDLPAGPEFLHALAVTPAGHRLATTGQDGVIRVWRADREKPLVEFAPPSPVLPATASR
ncbi:MAG: WD40 repeat domain-containing protein, partial [Verrucomicrobiota bacterium]